MSTTTVSTPVLGYGLRGRGCSSGPPRPSIVRLSTPTTPPPCTVVVFLPLHTYQCNHTYSRSYPWRPTWSVPTDTRGSRVGVAKGTGGGGATDETVFGQTQPDSVYRPQKEPVRITSGVSEDTHSQGVGALVTHLQAQRVTPPSPTRRGISAGAAISVGTERETRDVNVLSKAKMSLGQTEPPPHYGYFGRNNLY